MWIFNLSLNVIVLWCENIGIASLIMLGLSLLGICGLINLICIVAFRFGFEQSSYSVMESDDLVWVCVTADRGDGSEMYTLSLTSGNLTNQGKNL